MLYFIIDESYVTVVTVCDASTNVESFSVWRTKNHFPKDLDILSVVTSDINSPLAYTIVPGDIQIYIQNPILFHLSFTYPIKQYCPHHQTWYLNLFAILCILQQHTNDKYVVYIYKYIG